MKGLTDSGRVNDDVRSPEDAFLLTRECNEHDEGFWELLVETSLRAMFLVKLF
jgi:hypothetical protein